MRSLMGCCMATCGAWRPRWGTHQFDVVDELSKGIDTTVLSTESPDERGNGWPERQIDESMWLDGRTSENSEADRRAGTVAEIDAVRGSHRTAQQPR